MSLDRVIALVDMDCFYVQVEERRCPKLRGSPGAVVQYNKWKGGGIIAVNYEARAKGVKRNMRGDDARILCPEINLSAVPELRGKADLTRYRKAGAEVISVLCTFSDQVEKASVDEAFIDLTSVVETKLLELPSVTSLSNTHVVGFGGDRKQQVSDWIDSIKENEDMMAGDLRLCVAAGIVEEIRAAVYEKTQFRCSAGIAYNKVLAKLACGLNKPNGQTVLIRSAVGALYDTIPIQKVWNLGGKLGDAIVKDFGCTYMSDICKISPRKLEAAFGVKTSCWLVELCQGNDYDTVKRRQISQSIGCGKNFPGNQALTTFVGIAFWVKQMSDEVEERLLVDKQENKRTFKTLSLSLRFDVDKDSSSISKSFQLPGYDSDKICQRLLKAIRVINRSDNDGAFHPPVSNIGVSVHKLAASVASNRSLVDMFNDSKTVSVSETTMCPDSRGTDLGPELDHTTAALTPLAGRSPSPDVQADDSLTGLVGLQSKTHVGCQGDVRAGSQRSDLLFASMERMSGNSAVYSAGAPSSLKWPRNGLKNGESVNVDSASGGSDQKLCLNSANATNSKSFFQSKHEEYVTSLSTDSCDVAHFFQRGSATDKKATYESRGSVKCEVGAFGIVAGRCGNVGVESSSAGTNVRENKRSRTPSNTSFQGPGGEGSIPVVFPVETETSNSALRTDELSLAGIPGNESDCVGGECCVNSKDVPSSSADASHQLVDTMKCSQCSVWFPVDEIPDHLDMHVVVDLHNSLNPFSAHSLGRSLEPAGGRNFGGFKTTVAASRETDRPAKRPRRKPGLKVPGRSQMIERFFRAQ